MVRPIPEDMGEDFNAGRAAAVNKQFLPFLFQQKKEKLLSTVNDFRECAESSVLGDYSELGFLSTIMMILMED